MIIQKCYLEEQLRQKANAWAVVAVHVGVHKLLSPSFQGLMMVTRSNIVSGLPESSPFPGEDATRKVHGHDVLAAEQHCALFRWQDTSKVELTDSV